MKIINYQVVVGIGTREINEVVAEAIKEDWIPLGGVSVNTLVEQVSNGTKTITQYSQAMVKYEE